MGLGWLQPDLPLHSPERGALKPLSTFGSVRGQLESSPPWEESFFPRFFKLGKGCLFPKKAGASGKLAANPGWFPMTTDAHGEGWKGRGRVKDLLQAGSSVWLE